MFRELTKRIQYPVWAGTADSPSRWRRLDQLDRVLNGTIYDHLVHDFYQERREGQDSKILIKDRRPSSKYNLPLMVARWSSRKLWAGRHVPRISHEDKEVTKLVDQVIQTTGFFEWMMTATILGSVGSVAMTFRVDRTQDEPQVGFRVWRARDCLPRFDDFGNLTTLRVFMNLYGRELLSMGFTTALGGHEIRADQQYWWFRLYGPNHEMTLVPGRVDDWNPIQGWTSPGLSDTAMPDLTVEHGLGFLPGIWIKNLSGSLSMDGRGTWTQAVDNSIEIDYLLSQVSRGTRYNCAPTPVIVGTLREAEGGSGEMDYIHVDGSVKDQDGQTTGAGDAKLLEMSGNGVKAALEQIDKLRNMTLESIGATRKDPEKLKGVMSGRAMEFLDEDSHDLVMELRSSYGRGALELMRKVVRACGAGSTHDPKGLTLKWPRLYQPTPEDLAHLIPALVIAATPIQEPLDPESAAKMGGGDEDGESGGDGEGSGEQTHTAETRTDKKASGASTTVKTEVKKGPGTQGGRPSATPTGGKILGALLEVEEASEFLKIYMDIGLMPDSDEEGVSDSDEPTDVKPPPEAAPLAPNESPGSGEFEIPASP